MDRRHVQLEEQCGSSRENGSHLKLLRISWPLVGRYNPSPLPATTVVAGRYEEEYRSRATNLRVLLKMSLHYFPTSSKIFRVVCAIRFL